MRQSEDFGETLLRKHSDACGGKNHAELDNFLKSNEKECRELQLLCV
jgi:hypothetical protein